MVQENRKNTVLEKQKLLAKFCSVVPYRCDRLSSVQRDELESADDNTSTDMNVSNYRELCRQIYTQLPTTDMFEVLIELCVFRRK